MADLHKRVYTHTYQSPLGPLAIAVDRRGRVLQIVFGSELEVGSQQITEENKYACGEVEYQLDHYFAGDLTQFTVDVALTGTDFQRTVWNSLLKIGYGETITYGEIARKIGKKSAARAVGNAVAVNPIPIIVPCHRVLPASGKVGNYALRSLKDGSGTELKRMLLSLEGALSDHAVA